MSENITALSDAAADETGVRRFANAMADKLAAKRKENRGGWNRPHQASMKRLQKLLREHAEKGDPVDIANFAMIIWNRQHPHG
jgi:hypothetical protein